MLKKKTVTICTFIVIPVKEFYNHVKRMESNETEVTTINSVATNFI